MIKVGDEIKIVISEKLREQKLSFLCSQSGIVSCVKLGNIKNPGAFVTITKGRNKGEEWFIPFRSIRTHSIVEKIRNMSMVMAVKV